MTTARTPKPAKPGWRFWALSRGPWKIRVGVKRNRDANSCRIVRNVHFDSQEENGVEQNKKRTPRKATKETQHMPNPNPYPQPSWATSPSSDLETRLPPSSVPRKLLPTSHPKSSLREELEQEESRVTVRLSTLPGMKVKPKEPIPRQGGLADYVKGRCEDPTSGSLHNNSTSQGLKLPTDLSRPTWGRLPGFQHIPTARPPSKNKGQRTPKVGRGDSTAGKLAQSG